MAAAGARCDGLVRGKRHHLVIVGGRSRVGVRFFFIFIFSPFFTHIYIYLYTRLLCDFFFHGRKATVTAARSGCAPPHEFTDPHGRRRRRRWRGGRAFGKVDSRAVRRGSVSPPPVHRPVKDNAPVNGFRARVVLTRPAIIYRIRAVLKMCEKILNYFH